MTLAKTVIPIEYRKGYIPGWSEEREELYEMKHLKIQIYKNRVGSDP